MSRHYCDLYRPKHSTDERAEVVAYAIEMRKSGDKSN
jgi:hypothetical protein